MQKRKGFLRRYGNDYFFLAPWLLVFVGFTVIPIALAVGFSFTDFDMVQLPHFVGVDNYLQLFLADDIFIKALVNTLYFAVITGPLGYLLSFVIGWRACGWNSPCWGSPSGRSTARRSRTNRRSSAPHRSAR